MEELEFAKSLALGITDTSKGKSRRILNEMESESDSGIKENTIRNKIVSYAETSDKLVAYAQTRNNSTMLDSANQIAKIIHEIASNHIDGVVECYASILKSIKRVPLKKITRDELYEIYYPTPEAKLKAPARDWAIAASILSKINERLKDSKFLSNGSLIVALENTCGLMCKAGMKHPDAHGWMIMSKGPYHFVDFDYAMMTTIDYFLKALMLIKKISDKGGNIGTLIEFNPKNRPSRTPTKTLIEVRNLTTDKETLVDGAYAINPSYWRFCKDMRTGTANSGLSSGQIMKNYVKIFAYCDAILEIGRKMASPGLEKFIEKPKSTPASSHFGRVASVLSDIQFIIAFIKAPNGLGSDKQGIKTIDQLAYAAYVEEGGFRAKIKTSSKKSLADVMWSGYKGDVVFDEKTGFKIE